eukprot:3953734-Prymnesium_polylepis.3
MRPLNVEGAFCRLGLMQRTYRTEVRLSVANRARIDARKLVRTVGDLPFDGEDVDEEGAPSGALKREAMRGSVLPRISTISSCGMKPLFLSSQASTVYVTASA